MSPALVNPGKGINMTKNSSTNEPVRRLAYSPTEAAEALGCTRQHIYRLMGRGDLHAVKIGRLTRISAGEIERLLSVGTVKPRPSSKTVPISAHDWQELTKALPRILRCAYEYNARLGMWGHFDLPQCIREFVSPEILAHVDERPADADKRIELGLANLLYQLFGLEELPFDEARAVMEHLNEL